MGRKDGKYLTKIRFHNIKGYRGYGLIDHRYEVLYVCERCRIKDGLGQSQMHYATCSFCGRTTRVYYYRPSWGKTIARPVAQWNLWQRGKEIWKDHGSRKKRK